MRWVARLALAVVLAGPGSATAAPEVWKPEDPENILVVTTTEGQVYVELHPEIAPKAVERIKLLARRSTYNGMLFHRVIAGFVAQSGDPGNVDGGKTELPNLAPEFTFRLSVAIPHTVYAHPPGLSQGFIGALPYVSVAETATPKRDDGTLYAWGSYCPGVMGMGRDAARDSANSEIFFMLGAYPAIDRDYTPVGNVLIGFDVLQALAVGEPPASPDSMIKVAILADMKEAPNIEVMDSAGPDFAARVMAVRAARGADFSICDVTVPARLVP